jgi:hypothetical protein
LADRLSSLDAGHRRTIDHIDDFEPLIGEPDRDRPFLAAALAAALNLSNSRQ